MRKQTKLVAVLSTAALLALGASMSSFAATGWQEENGTWVYYDKNGDKETEKWEKSGDNWFYLNEDGEMATDVIVEYNDNYYYVDENGSMVANKWVSIENTDYDGDNEDEPSNHWYYFGANGKAYKSSTNSNNANFKSINGKKYIFDDEGKMLYGWIGEDGERKTGDDAWESGNGVYYCGTENDGAQAVGWSYIDIKDSNYESEGVGLSSKNVFDDEDQTRWFYFKSNGKKMTGEKGKTINGKKYSFDEHGRMNAEWVNWKTTPSTASAAAGDAAYSKGFRYYGSPEDGARITKGWFQVVPDSYLNLDDYNDDESNWYYSNKDGELTTKKLETINGKKYAFDEYGVMQDGLKFIKLDTDNKTIVDIKKGDSDSAHKFDTTDDFRDNAAYWENKEYNLYYFGSGDDGAMKTSKQTVTIDGDSHSFLFQKSGGKKGAGKTGVDSKKYYQSGMLMKADKDDKYAVLSIVKDGSTIKSIELLSTDEFLDRIDATSNITGKENKYSEFYNVEADAKDTATLQYRLVNTSGAEQKGKNKAKDGDDRCYEVKNNGEIKSVFVED
ncbi:cell wall-binding protein [Lacrimispora sp.]|uniref:cell wall-binding protein n=1 Tax=Lacrimispora sp. TaxID=2719234 RepID=UPI0028A799C1|nr:cell wall-binding protein [Lacrimispora sp.]